MNDHQLQSKQRTLHPVIAILSVFVGLGLAFVYVGELRLAIACVLCVYGLIAVAGWTGIMSSSVAGVWVVTIACLAIYAASAIWPAITAFRDRHRAAKPYNRWWFYLLWSLSALVLSVSEWHSCQD